MPAVSSLPAVTDPDCLLVPEACPFSFQDENDNPPTFSKPAYFVSVVENIMAGTARVGEAGRHSIQGAGLTLHACQRPLPSLCFHKWDLWRCAVVHQPAVSSRAPTVCRHCWTLGPYTRCS